MSQTSAGLSPEYLRANLKALALKSPRLCERLNTALDDNHIEVVLAASGAPTARLRDSKAFLHSPHDPAGEAAEATCQLPPAHDRAVLCLGLGLGYYLEALLSKSNPCLPVIAYERDPCLLRLTLMRRDFARDILAGRVIFLLGTDLALFPPKNLQALSVWPHPVLLEHYDWEQRLLNPCRLSSAAPQRAMVVAGGLFTLDVTEALQSAGIAVEPWNIGSFELESAFHHLCQADPQLVVAINFHHGLPELCESLGVALIVWEIDPTVERLELVRGRYPRTHIYTYRKSRVAHYRAAGFEKVEYLPLGTNPGRRYPQQLNADESCRYGAEVAFVGSSMVEQAEALAQLYQQLTRDRPTHLRSAGPALDYAVLWETALEQQRRSPDQYVIEEVFRHHLNDGSWVVTDRTGRQVDLSICTAERAAAERRGSIMTALAAQSPRIHSRVWGDAGWPALLPEAIDYAGPAGHFHELTAIYNASAINLDINRIYQQDIVTMRVFDVLACRGFLLADHSDALTELFELDQEVVAYRSIEEIPALVEHFLSHPEEREDLAAAGYQKVIREHTIEKRVQAMLLNLH
jgi:hypothetical protein